MLYVITERDSRSHVKIGYTATEGEAVDIRAVRARLSGLQVATWRRLVCVAVMPGSKADEKAMHRRFAAYRVSGEWFANRGEVAEWVLTIRMSSRVEIAEHIGAQVEGSDHASRMLEHTRRRNERQRAQYQERKRAAKKRAPVHVSNENDDAADVLAVVDDESAA